MWTTANRSPSVGIQLQTNRATNSIQIISDVVNAPAQEQNNKQQTNFKLRRENEQHIFKQSNAISRAGFLFSEIYRPMSIGSIHAGTKWFRKLENKKKTLEILAWIGINSDLWVSAACEASFQLKLVEMRIFQNRSASDYQANELQSWYRKYVHNLFQFHGYE